VGEVVAMNPKALLDRIELPEIRAPDMDEGEEIALVTAKSSEQPAAGKPGAASGGKSGGLPKSDGGGPSAGGMDPSAMVDSIFMRYDKNRDGQLSKDEIPSESAARFAKGDANGDGNIEKTEMLQAMRAMTGGASGGSR
jgi:hypothetical protein